MQTKRPYLFYENLSFIWSKKLILLIVPILFSLILGIVGHFFSNNANFSGETVIYTGSVKSESLTNPDYLLANYGSELKDDADIFVSGRSYIKLRLEGNDQTSIETQLNQFAEGTLEGLNGFATRVIDQSQNYVNIQEQRIAQLEESIALYQPLLEQAQTTVEVDNYQRLLTSTEMELTNALATVQRVSNDIVVYEMPSLVSTEVNPKSTLFVEGAVAGFLGGLILTIAFLLLWKYVLDARNYKVHKE